ncbi:Ppx/GppA phosphatase family protein [Actinomadura barringtoniae]|uniref:Ppx/GppA phosphatase family protein n=1 Tax=Actinomadura barringtoniae TaxID=1427535 RepID=UPI0027DD020D|nr:Ppx/GppA family phosphatase [Actinomadura barringtoniae]
MKVPVGLAEATDRRGVIDDAAIGGLIKAVREAVVAAEAAGAEELIPFATAAVRDAANGAEVVAEVRAATGVALEFMDGEREARLTFCAARSWYGWSGGPLLLADIGGGSMEIAYGSAEAPEFAVSLPLGAGLLTRHHLDDRAPVKRKRCEALHAHVHDVLAHVVDELAGRPAPVRAAATSRTFFQLARLCGAPKSGKGPYVSRTLDRDDLKQWIPELAALTAKRRAELPGIKASRAHQILAGAVVAHATMEALGLSRWEICPWAIREGVMLERLARLAQPAETSPPLLAFTGRPAPGVRLTPQLRNNARRGALHVVSSRTP